MWKAVSCGPLCGWLVCRDGVRLHLGGDTYPTPLWRHSAPIPPSMGDACVCFTNTPRHGAPKSRNRAPKAHHDRVREAFASSPLEGGMGAECLHRGVCL